jgi:hypothetical protein
VDWEVKFYNFDIFSPPPPPHKFVSSVNTLLKARANSLITLNNSQFNALVTKIYVVKSCKAPINTQPWLCGHPLCSMMSQEHGDYWLLLYDGDDWFIQYPAVLYRADVVKI